MSWLYGSWSDVVDVVASGVLVYVGVIIIIRIAGVRSTAKMNNYDWVVTLAVASIAAASVISPSTTVVQGLAGIAVLVALQALATGVSSRVPWFNRLMRPEVVVLVHEGEYQPRAMRRARVTQDEIRKALRADGHREVDEVGAVVLEIDGTLSVLPRPSPSG